ncbi:MAG: RimK-like ATPgrasp N-terminal domain-containing protein [bacterium]
MRNLIVVNNLKYWNISIENVEIVSVKSYLLDPAYAEIRNARIFNLCKSYKYQSTGYYVSLLAEGRGHRAFPSITVIQDFASQTIVRAMSDEIDELIQKCLSKLKSKEFVLSIYFGKNIAKQYTKLSQNLYNLFQSPFLRAHFIFSKKWTLCYTFFKATALSLNI